MSRRYDRRTAALLAVSAGLAAAASTMSLLTLYYRHIWFETAGSFCAAIIRRCPDARQVVLDLLKTRGALAAGTEGNILSAFGYQPSDLWPGGPASLWLAGLGGMAGGVLLLVLFRHWHKRSAARIKALTDDLENINTGRQGALLDGAEDEFSMLRDEIYKTVTALYQARDAALAARSNFAENLSNIAHQLKTPVTSISLSVQMLRERLGDAPFAGIERQLGRLSHLEDALLLLARIDAGTLTLERRPTDVFTLLMLAADNLEALFAQAGVSMDIPEMEEATIRVDLEWTMEAVMNLMKNCMEASEAGAAVHCSWESNPLYVQIRIWDEGAGFAKDALPHIFERFYRGRNAGGTGIGIGLSLSKAIVEMQSGVIRAFNLPSGGACFEIRLYSH